jgi:hypothetical protein
MFETRVSCTQRQTRMDLPIQKIEKTKCVRCKSKWEEFGCDGCDWGREEDGRLPPSLLDNDTCSVRVVDSLLALTTTVVPRKLLLN